MSPNPSNESSPSRSPQYDAPYDNVHVMEQPRSIVAEFPDRRENLSWRSVLAGSTVALLAYSGLLALGLAFGGANLQGVIQGPDTLRGLGVGTMIWMVISVAASLFAGGYVATRSRPRVSDRLATVQGLVVSSVVLLFLLTRFGAGLTSVGQMGGMAVQDPRFQQVVEDAIGADALRSPPDQVARGVAARLIRGETNSAAAYYASQTGLTTEEAQLRITQMSEGVSRVTTDTTVAAARALKFAGWLIFSMLVFGTAGSFLGGRMGNRKNVESYATR